MPSFRIDNDFISVTIFDAVGLCTEGAFVLHAGLAAASGVYARSSVGVIHMEPPLGGDKFVTADVYGTVPLTDGEIRKIRLFVAKHLGEHAELQHLRGWSLFRRSEEGYCIHPHALPRREQDGRYARLRFSCAGFVYEAYRRVRIRLLDLSAVPHIGLSMLKQSYPQFSNRLDDPDFRAAMGLAGDGPWPVMLCGYLFHSLDRPDSEIRNTPYPPRESDAWFS